MTVDELKKGEHETVEYKQDIPKDKDKYLKTAVAFANAAGGRLIFGVENNTWDVLGFSDDEVFQKYDSIANSIFDACTPSVVPIMEIEEIDGKKIIVANILPGMAKPYYLRKDGMMDGTYVRVAGVTRKAEPYMIKELQLEGTNTSFDAMQVAGDDIPQEQVDALCERMYQHALSLCKSDEQRRTQKKVTARHLVSWKVLVQFQGKYYPTNAWKLLTGDTEELLPDAFIQMAAFKGTSRAVFLDKQGAQGPIDQQIEEALLFVKRHINLGSRIEGVYREDIYELPIDSIREMISNAVCHRSYLSPGSIQVAIYDDRLEVTLPGRLSPDLTLEQLIAGNSRVKNVAIGAAFQYMHVIEKWGTGIPRIYEDAEAYGLGAPEIKDFGTSFRITLHRRPFETDPFGVKKPAVEGQKSGGLEEKLAVEASKSGGSKENPAVESSKSGDSKENPAIQSTKSGEAISTIDKIGWDLIESRCFERKYNHSSTEKIKMLYNSIASGQSFSASNVRQLVGCADSTARSLITKLKAMDVIISVHGKGKGVYRFKLRNE